MILNLLLKLPFDFHGPTLMQLQFKFAKVQAAKLLCISLVSQKLQTRTNTRLTKLFW